MNILIIQILRLGDAIQLTPVISGLKAVFENSRIHVLTSSLGSKILSPQQEIDHVYEVGIEEITRLVKTSELNDLLAAVDIIEENLKPVLGKQWDWVINFDYSFPSGLIAYLVEGKNYSGFYATSKRQFFAKEKWFAYSISSFLNRKYSAFNWVDINKHIVNLPSAPQHTMFPVKPEISDNIDLHLDTIGFSGQNVVGLTPGASGAYKQWPVTNFIALARSLVRDHGYKILIFGDENDRDLCDQIDTAAGVGCENLCGKTSISELAGYLSKCDLLVSNDSGPMHIANAVGTPVVSLFFSTHFVETGAYGKDNIVVFPDIPCFPCQSTADCSHKECLTYIRPETIVKIVCDRQQLVKGDHRIALTDEEGHVGINRSVFDAWGNLDWIPVNNRSLTLHDIIRLIFKTFWISALNGSDTQDEDLQWYIDASLKNYGPVEKKNGFGDLFHQFETGFSSLEDLYRQSHILSMQIYNALIHGDQDTVAKLGEMLQQKEDEISRTGDDEYLSPLTEYTNIRLDNMGKTGMAHLAIKTAGIYQEAEQLSQRLRWSSDKISHRILPN